MRQDFEAVFFLMEDRDLASESSTVCAVSGVIWVCMFGTGLSECLEGREE